MEQFRAPIFADNVCDKNGWSLGPGNNLREVLGLSPVVWCLPLPAHLGDGLAFPHSRAHQHTTTTTTYNSFGGQYRILVGVVSSVPDPDFFGRIWIRLTLKMLHIDSLLF